MNTEKPLVVNVGDRLGIAFVADDSYALVVNSTAVLVLNRRGLSDLALLSNNALKMDYSTAVSEASARAASEN